MSVHRLCLGTAKLGMPWYGAGSVSRPDHGECQRILRAAIDLGIRHFDTGRAYGDAEDLLMEYAPDFHTIITKTAPDLWETTTGLEGWRPLLLHNPTIAEIHERPQADGASVYTPDEARACIASHVPSTARWQGFYTVLQVPYCVLDQRHAAVIADAKAAGIAVYARQPFLQGLLVNDLPLPDALRDATVLLAIWRETCARFAISRVEAALRFALASPADFIVFGCGSEVHLREVAAIANAPEPLGWPELLACLRAEFREAAVQLRSLWSAPTPPRG